MVGSMPCVNTTVRPRWPDALGILEIFIAISATSLISHPCASAKVTASDQGLTLVHARAQLEQLQDTCMSYFGFIQWIEELKLS